MLNLALVVRVKYVGLTHAQSATGNRRYSVDRCLQRILNVHGSLEEGVVAAKADAEVVLTHNLVRQLVLADEGCLKTVVVQVLVKALCHLIVLLFDLLQLLVVRLLNLRQGLSDHRRTISALYSFHGLRYDP